jgi:predicted ester cyclase
MTARVTTLLRTLVANQTDSQGAKRMSSEENLQTVRQLFKAFYAADDGAMGELIGDDFVTHAPGGSTGNAAGWKAMAHQLLGAIPDNRTEIDDIIGDGDTVAVRYTCRGTHNGELFGVAATNRTLTTSGIEMYRLSGGRIVECWGQYDMSQLFTPAS